MKKRYGELGTEQRIPSNQADPVRLVLIIKRLSTPGSSNSFLLK